MIACKHKNGILPSIGVSEQKRRYGKHTWERTTLGGALPIRYGKARNEKHGVVREDTAVYGSSGIIDTFDRALTNGATLIIGRKGTVGATHYSPDPCWPIDTVYFAEAEPDKDLRFFKYLLDHLQLGKMDRSTAVPGLSRDDYNAKEVFIPLVDEQRQIVAEIEKQFTRLEAGVAGLRRVLANLKRYRAAVLKAACEGKLVPTESEWPHKPLSLGIRTLDQGWSPRCETVPSNDENTWAVIKTTAIQPLRFVENENKKLPTSLKPRPQLELLVGDLLVTRAGPRSRVGVACLVKTTRPKLMLCDKAYRIRCHPDTLKPAFLEIALNAPQVVDSINELKTGISDSGVNLTQKRFGELLIPFPPCSEQQQIVAEVERRLSVVDEFEAGVNANVQRTTRLRQAVLQKAFSAGLVDRSN